jgi:hypothetical protein
MVSLYLIESDQITCYVFLGTVLITTTQNEEILKCRKVILAIPPSQISSFNYFLDYKINFIN